MEKIKIIKNRSDIGAGTRGSDMGIDAIEIAAINCGSDFFNRYSYHDVETENDVVFSTLDARIKKHEMRREFIEPIGRDDHRSHRNFSGSVEGNVVESAVRRVDLILRADGFFQQILFQMNALIGELFLRGHVALEGVESVEETDREGGAAAHSAAGGEVAVVMNLNPAIEVHKFQRGAHRGMLYFFNSVCALDLRIHHAKLMVEKRRQMARVNVAVLVDGGGKHRAAVLAVPARIVRAAAKHRDAIGGSSNNHFLPFVIIFRPFSGRKK